MKDGAGSKQTRSQKVEKWVEEKAWGETRNLDPCAPGHTANRAPLTLIYSYTLLKISGQCVLEQSYKTGKFITSIY